MYAIVRANRIERLYYCGDPIDKPGRTLPVAGWTPDRRRAREYATLGEAVCAIHRLREGDLTLEAHGYTIAIEAEGLAER